MNRKELFNLIGLSKESYDSFKFYNVVDGLRMVYYGIKSSETLIDGINDNMKQYNHNLEFKDEKMVITVKNSIPYGLKESEDTYHEKISKIAYFLWLKHPENSEIENWRIAEETYRNL